MANYRIIGHVIQGLKSMTDIMSFALGDGKALGIHTNFNWDFNLKDKDPTCIKWDNVPELLKSTKEEQSSELQIVFLGIIALIDTETNIGYSVNKAWWDPKVKSITDNGINFITLENALEQLEYTVKTDGDQNIMEVSHKSSKYTENANNDNE